MKRVHASFAWSVATLSLFLCPSAFGQPSELSDDDVATTAQDVDAAMLQERLKYIRRGPVLNLPPEGANERFEAPSDEEDQVIRIDPCCLVACYSRAHDDSIEFIGTYPLPGDYEGTMCRPKGHEDDDLSQISVFSSYCAQIFPERCENDACWVGGDTGGFVESQALGLIEFEDDAPLSARDHFIEL